ncbi:S8 family peptidase [Priestia koreensis]|uniref:S8 family peptidase n=1 Tax=Priestia koreensis TaxID=284581 RepID=UPI00301629B3
MKRFVKQWVALGVTTSLIGASFMPGVSTAKEKEKLLEPKKVSISALKKQAEKLGLNTKKSQVPLSADTLVIKYDRPLSAADHARAGAVVIKQISSLKYAVVKVKKKGDMNNVLKAYQKNSKVISASPSVNYEQFGTVDPKASKQYHLSLLEIAKAQKLAGANKVKVAVIDSGVDPNHPELKGSLLPAYNAVNPMNQASPHFHATHVAGIIAGEKDNGVGGYGVNPNANILPIDVFDGGMGASDYVIAEGILYAVEHGAKVINMSLGSSYPSPLLKEAIKTAIDKNVTVVASSGNDGMNQRDYPASFEGVISVGSTNKDNKLSSYSNYGASVDLVAPGEDVYSSIYYEGKSTFANLSGTSMSSPVVAGAASLLLSKYPNLTPAQVEYVLEHTAKDLGAKGYDTKFGNGLVNPLGALQYDVTKIPASVQNPKTEQQILAAAKQVELKDELVQDGALTKPNEEQWIKFDVKKGEYIQTALAGSDNYDYKYKIHLYSKDGNDVQEVDKVQDGKAEGKLYKVPADGVLAIGVKDTNGNYDNSGAKKSAYKLSLQRLAEVPEDNISLKNPVEVGALPYNSADKKLTFSGINGDSDFFKVKVDEPQVVKVKLSGVAGVDSSIRVYAADQLFVSSDDENAPPIFMDESKLDDKVEPMFAANTNGYSEGETLAFEAIPGVDYYIRTTNESYPSYGYIIFNSLTSFDMMFEDATPQESALPYEVSIDSKVLPEDEDGLPIQRETPEDGLAKGNLTVSEYAGQKAQETKSVVEAQSDSAEGEASDDVDQVLEDIKARALPYKLGETNAEGYIQSLEDEDWFAITPERTAIYDFTFNKDGNVPMFEVYKLGKYKGENGKTYETLEPVISNLEFGWFSDTFKDQVSVGLRKGEKYFAVARTPYGNPSLSFDPYKISSKLLVDNPEDKYEDNDTPEQAKTVSEGTITGNFGLPNDMDFYYVNAKQTGISGVFYKQQELTKELAAKYPSSLLNQAYGVPIIIEDTNNNHKLDNDEMDKIRYVERLSLNGSIYGSFPTKKGKNYFVGLLPVIDSSTQASLIPYNFTIANVSTKDEDAGSVVKNNVPSKPLSLKPEAPGLWTAKGHLNAGVVRGDQDWYVLDLKKAAKGTITFDVGDEIDGVVSLYKDGKLIATSNHYLEGDAEVIPFNLGKGKYHIEVKDVNGNSTINPYKLSVKFQ